MKILSYLYLTGAIFFGIIANGYFLKTSEGFTKIIPSAISSIFIIATVFCLSRAMNTIPVAFTYATYGGLTITGVTVLGLIKFNQTPNFFSLIGIVLIVLGVFLINYYGTIIK